MKIFFDHITGKLTNHDLVYSLALATFDEDEYGHEAIKSITNILPKNKLKIVHLPMKDPNQMLLSGKSHEVIQILNNLN